MFLSETGRSGSEPFRFLEHVHTGLSKFHGERPVDFEKFFLKKREIRSIIQKSACVKTAA